jgi:hypothetical protein
VAGRVKWVSAFCIWLFNIPVHNFIAEGEVKVVPVQAIKACAVVEI